MAARVHNAFVTTVCLLLCIFKALHQKLLKNKTFKRITGEEQAEQGGFEGSETILNNNDAFML